ELAAGAAPEYPPQEIWWCRYQALAALRAQSSLPGEEAEGSDDAWLALDRAREVMLVSIANLTDAGLRRNSLNKVAVNRQIVEEWLSQAARLGMPLVPLTDGLGGSGGGQEQFRRMIDIGLRLNARREAADLARLVVDQVVELTGAERAILHRVNEAGQRQVVAEFAADAALPAVDVALLLELVSLKRQAVLRHVPPEAPELEQLSQLCVPLVVAGTLVGLLYADVAGTFGAFTGRDRDLLSVLANQAAVALENAAWAESLELRVRERTADMRAANHVLEQRTAELEIINRVQQGLAAQLDMQAIYDLVGDKIRDIFDAQAVVITTYDQANGLQSRRYCIERGQRFRVEEPHPFSLLSEHLMRNRQPVLIDEDATRRCKELGMPPPVTGTDPKSLLFVPLIAGNQVTGSISLQNLDREHAFGDSDVRLLTTLANSMSVALENARLFDERTRLLEESRQLAAELTTVNRISQAAASELDLEALIQTVGEQVRQTFGADVAYVALLDRQSDMIRFQYSYGEDMPPMPLGKGLTSWIIQAGRPLLINRDYQARVVALGVALIGLIPESYLGVPIPVGGQAIGVISVQSMRKQGRFDEDDLRLLSTIAANVGGALHNARLYRETERRAFQMATIAEVSREVSATLALDAVLAGIAGHVHSLFQAQDTVLRLLQDDGRSFRTIVSMGRYAEQFRSDLVTFGEGIAGHIAQSGVAEVVDDPMKDPRGVHVPGTLEVEESPETLMCAPLLSRGQTLGLLSVYRDRA
ncbi:MAG TPA: GAF domain-containing protein, partial [Anaerolineae bacterium]|nr:GAF domain-containing protein [Anaerolineae bacterium]